MHKIKVEQNTKNLISRIPKEVSQVTNTLEKTGFEAYLVVGCVRDLFMSEISFESDDSRSQNDLSEAEGGKEPKDCAKPEQIIKLFEKTIYENTFGTVGVCVSRETQPHPNPLLKGEGEFSSFHFQGKAGDEVIRETSEYMVIEVTPYRTEAKYSDFRHPDDVQFSDKLEDDLKRRDFTINAMALRTSSVEGGLSFGGKGHLVDLFDGIKDIKDKTLRAVGNPDDRFAEDALRMLRAVRFACQLNFSVAYETMESILKNANLIKKISSERIHDEFVRIILSENPASGITMLQKFGLLKNIIPELEEGIGCEQLGEHIYDVWNHLLHAVQHSADKKWSLEIRLAALFHDIGKPRSRRLAELWIPQGKTLGIQKGLAFSRSTKKKYTFYGHEVVGARMAKKIMERLKFPKKEIELVEKLVYNHMFFSDTELITLSAVRRIIA